MKTEIWIEIQTFFNLFLEGKDFFFALLLSPLMVSQNNH